MPKRGDRVAPPPPPGGWEVRYANKQAVDGWEELRRSVPNNLFQAWSTLVENPDTPVNYGRHHRLRGELGTSTVRTSNSGSIKSRVAAASGSA